MTVLRCIARRAAAASPIRQQARSLYTVPTLDRHDQLAAQGVPGLFSQEGFHTAFTARQQHTVDELNAMTQGTPHEGKDIKSLIIEHARDPTKAYTFNVASMAFNNHFFFRGINTNSEVVSTPAPAVLQQINRDFGTLDTLRETFIATAQAMFGPGFVWLVQLKDTPVDALRILPTYIAGSPLSGAHYRRQSHDMNTHNADSHKELNQAGSFNHPNTKPTKPLGGTDIVPLLCVNTWEHAWLHDYGVTGKDAYLRAWWNKIDWNQVRQNGQWKKPETNSFHFYSST